MGIVATYSSEEIPLENWSTPMQISSGLNYYGYRYYDPVTGRWPSRDRLGDDAFFFRYTKNLSKKITLKLRDENMKNQYCFISNTSVGL